MAKIYSYGDVKLNVSCEQYLETQGIEVKNKRCRATWRGGTHDSVAVDGWKFFDHVEKRGGSVIDLCAMIQFGGDITRAVQWLGERFNLVPVRETKARPKKTRAQILADDGFSNTATYDYTDEIGNLFYQVCRFEKEGEKKEFVQRTPDHEGLGSNTPRFPYNLPALVRSDEVFIVEGEKDVETLRTFGLTGTTNSGGAKNWDPSLNHWFKDKKVVILPDNDEPGAAHAKMLVGMLKPIAKSVKVLRLSSQPKGDITDWVENEGGSAVKLRELVSALTDTESSMSPQVAKAKQANETPFRNFVEMEVPSGNGKKVKEFPVTVNLLIGEVKTRFLDYPRAIGSNLFDWNKDKGLILELHTPDELFAWIERISKHVVEWSTGRGYVSRGVLFSALQQSAVKYSSIAPAPHYPPRSDVFYTYEQMPPPDITHSSFWTLVSFFNPCNAANRTALAALLLAPLFYSPNADRPMWVIDTNDQQGSGKSKLAQYTALLYGSEYLAVDMRQLDQDVQSVRRRMISTDARSKRIVLFDNVKTKIASANLAQMVTDKFITGLAPYGRTEESRPNDMTYIITVNNAEMDTDIASRVYTVRVAQVKDPDPMWERNLAKFIEVNRLQIYADMIHMVENNQFAHLRRRKSRFGMFDQTILSAVCRSEDEFRAVDAALSRENDVANLDLEDGQEFRELFLDRMAHANAPRLPGALESLEEREAKVDFGQPIFIRMSDVDWMLAHSDGKLKTWKSREILGLIRNGRVPGFDRHVQRVNARCPKCFDGTVMPHFRGFLWKGGAVGHVEAQVVARGQNSEYFKVIGITPFDADDDEPAPTNVGNLPPNVPAPAGAPSSPVAPPPAQDDYEPPLFDETVN